MYKFKIIICVLLLAVLYSCSSDDDNISFESEAVSLTIESSYSFKAGDAIGLFVEKRSGQNTQSEVGNSNYKTNIKWIYQEEGNWKPEGTDDIIYTSADGMPLDIYAYFPFSDQATTSEIKISSSSGILTGASLNISSTESKLTLNNRTVLTKVILPDADVLSSLQVTMLDVLSGGTIYPGKLGQENDFSVSTNKRDLSLTFENGYYTAYLPEQVLENNKHLLKIKDGDKTTDYILPEQIHISKSGENIVVANTSANNLVDMPNTFMLNPGNEIFISVQKAYEMWRTNELLISTSPDLKGTLTAETVWQEDSHEVIESIDIIGTGENAVIHVKTKVGKFGNAIIAVKIGETIRWSWQLWVSDYNPSSGDKGAIYAFNGLTFMDRNLGATSDPKTGGDGTFGLYYQWGRKDPFPTRGNMETAGVASEIKNNLANSITFPSTFITSSSSPNDWYTKTGNSGLDRWNGEDNKKTAFDPCPKGWRVPATGTGDESPWHGLNLPENEDKWGNGWYFDETPLLGYYPAAGQRTAAGGTTYAGSAGFYHTAKPNTTMRLDFTSVDLNFGGGKAAGRSVRCVKEN